MFSTTEYDLENSPSKSFSVRETYSDTYPVCVIKRIDVIARDTYNSGANPFNPIMDSIRSVSFSLESIIHGLDIIHEDDYFRTNYNVGGVMTKHCCWNPFVINKNGLKEYYQRDFVWTKADMRNLIDSIYEGIDCGKILVRKRSFKELEKMVANGETDIAFNDIVDGKQRLKAVVDFIDGKFDDNLGNYYSDLSNAAQHKFVNHQLFSYAEIPEDSSDELVINQFLKLNFTGVKQSKKHIEFVKSLRERI